MINQTPHSNATLRSRRLVRAIEIAPEPGTRASILAAFQRTRQGVFPVTAQARANDFFRIGS